MGMFDYVKYEADCFSCGEPLKDFQSKDHKCLLKTVSPKKVKRFYTSCDNCKAWNEFKVKTKIKIKSIERIIVDVIDGDEPSTRTSRADE